MKKKLAIVESHPLILFALARIAQQWPEFEVTHLCHNGQQVAEKLTEHPVDIVIAEETFILQEKISGDGYLLLHQYLQQNKLVILTESITASSLTKMIEIGASVAVSKHDGIKEIENACQHILADKSNYFSPSIQDVLESVVLRKIKGSELSVKEREVVSLLSSGISLVQIAKMKNRSVSTVATHKYNAMRKLNISSNVELIRYVVENT